VRLKRTGGVFSASELSHADALPTRSLTTARHAQASPDTELALKLGLCSTIPPEAPLPVTLAACFLSLVSLVRFQPGTPRFACIRGLLSRPTGRTPSGSARLPRYC
jgi:hypothetical protein